MPGWLQSAIVLACIAAPFAGIWLYQVLFGIDGRWSLPPGPDDDFHYN